MNQSEQINELAAALSKAQGEITGAVKDSKNPFFKSNYADLASVWDACRAQLSKNGLSVSQTTEWVQEIGICVNTTLMHSSGQWIKGVIPIMAVKNDPQGMGSAITYARRYALAAIVGIAQVDDDAEAAQGRFKGSVYPEQPTAIDGVRSAGAEAYLIPFGKYARRALEDIDLRDLRSYVKYIEDKALKDGKPLVGVTQEFVARASAHIAAIENSETVA